MYSTFNVASPEVIFSDSHIAINCIFKDNDTPVDISTPEFHLYAGASTGEGIDVTSGLDILRPVQKDAGQETGNYIVTFLSDNLTAGDYFALFKGTRGNEVLSFGTKLTLHEISRTQQLIEWLLGSLKGKYNLMIPNQFFTFDPRKRPWTDGECYDALIRALNDINTIPPALDSSFTLESCPLVSQLIMGGQIYCLFSAASLEAMNYFDVSVPIKISFYKGDKLKDLMSFIKTDYFAGLKEWKQNYWFNNIQEQIIVMQRVPIRIVRPLSDSLYFHRLAW